MEKQQQVMELWRRCFEDTEDFIRFYFKQKYSDNNSLVYEENGKALSALQMLPYPMSWENTILQTSYISGACTLQEARNRGIMTMLLKTAFQEMYKRGIAISTLIPAEDWLFDYYANQGYATVFEYTLSSILPHMDEIPANLRVYIPETYEQQSISGFYNYFNRKLLERPCCIQHTEDDFLTIVQELYMSQGRLAVTYTDHPLEPSGIAFAFPHAGKIIVNEILYDSTTEKNALLNAFSKIWNTHTVNCKLPVSGSGSRRLGMARVIHAGQMLQQYARNNPRLSLVLKLNDPLLSGNNGIYTLKNGQCLKTNTNEKSDIETDIPVLTKALLGYHTHLLPVPLSGLFKNHQPHMSLMLD